MKIIRESIHLTDREKARVFFLKEKPNENFQSKQHGFLKFTSPCNCLYSEATIIADITPTGEAVSCVTADLENTRAFRQVVRMSEYTNNF